MEGRGESHSKACWDAVSPSGQAALCKAADEVAINIQYSGARVCVCECACVCVLGATFFMRMLRLSEAFLTNGDFLERVELSLSLRFICKDHALNQTVGVVVLRSASASCCYPADVLALRAGGERLGADDGVPPHERVLLADVRTALFGSNYRAALRRRRAARARLLVDLERAKVVGKVA